MAVTQSAINLKWLILGANGLRVTAKIKSVNNDESAMIIINIIIKVQF
jgi:hypothetical protein